MRAFGYVRISHDPSGTSISPDRQHSEIERAAAAKGFEIVEWFEDRDRSAYRRVRRPLFEAMLARVHEVDAIFAWEASRLARRTVIGAGLLDTLEEANVRLVSVTQGDSLEVPRAMFEMSFVFAAEESRIKSERVKSAKAYLAAQGKLPFSARAYGWQREDDGSWTQVPDEVEWIRYMVERYLAGAGTLRIAGELNEAGVATRGGAEWTPTTVLKQLRSHRLIGYVTLHGEPTTTEPILQPIIDTATWKVLQAELRRRARHRVTASRGDSELSSIAECVTCGGRMYVMNKKVRPVYACRRLAGHNTVIDQRWLEKECARQLFERLELPANRSELDAAEGRYSEDSSNPDERVRATIARLEWGREELRHDFYQERLMDREGYEAQLGEIEERIAILEDKLVRQSDDEVQADRVRSLGDVRGAWPALTPDERKAIFSIAIRRVLVRKADFGGQRPTSDRITVEWAIP